MLKDDIKLYMGINNNGFDTIITNFINSAKQDMQAEGIATELIQESDALVYSALFSYVMGELDEEHADMYKNSYRIKCDQIRKNIDYMEVV